MTGFGQGSVVSGAGVGIRVEIGSVNRRSFDAQISLPKGVGVLEGRCHTRLQERLHRGRVQVRVRIDAPGNVAGAAFDPVRAEGLLREVNLFAEERGLEPIRSVAELLGLVGSLRDPAAEEGGDVEELWVLLREALDLALEELDTMRAKEGAHLRTVLGRLLSEVGEVLAGIEPLLPEARAEMEIRLRAAVASLGGAAADLEPRLLQEIALYAERADIREELDRIGGHLEQFRERLAQEGPLGRSLDFLCQELAREFNTLSVKASRSDINRLALAGKERVEMLREQVQNVE